MNARTQFPDTANNNPTKDVNPTYKIFTQKTFRSNFLRRRDVLERYGRQPRRLDRSSNSSKREMGGRGKTSRPMRLNEDMQRKDTEDMN